MTHKSYTIYVLGPPEENIIHAVRELFKVCPNATITAYDCTEHPHDRVVFAAEPLNNKIHN